MLAPPRVIEAAKFAAARGAELTPAAADVASNLRRDIGGTA
jgi:hypothetical protein